MKDSLEGRSLIGMADGVAADLVRVGGSETDEDVGGAQETSARLTGPTDQTQIPTQGGLRGAGAEPEVG
jgi:hypothetical protein